MTSRRGSHVRPRPPSSGRPSVRPVRAAAPDRGRVRQHKGLEARRRRAPLVLRTGLAILVVLLAGGAFLLASDGVGPVLASLGNSISSALGRLSATAAPTQTIPPTADSPRIAIPQNSFTNVPQVELSISVPVDALGDTTAKVRIYLALTGLEAVPVVDVPIGTTSTMLVPFDLENGRNDVTATLFRGTVESEQSPIVTYFLDRDPPKITVTSPKNNAAIEAPVALVKGKTQPNTSLVARNLGNGSSISAVADREGLFEFGLPLAPGTNDIEIAGTDPAGNVGTTRLTLLQGSAEMVVRLNASSYRLSVAHLPASLQLVVVVRDPAGEPLAGASAFFTLQIPGLAPISNQLVTGPDGRAVFTTALVGEVTAGGGIGTVQVTSDLYGTSTDRVTLTFVK